MKIFIPSSGDSLESPIDSHFGRCKYYIIYDIVLDNYEIFRNPFVYMENASGSSLALTIINKGIEYIIASNIGIKTFELLKENFVRIYSTFPGSTVREAITDYLQGNLLLVDEYNPSEPIFQPHNLN